MNFIETLEENIQDEVEVFLNKRNLTPSNFTGVNLKITTNFELPPKIFADRIEMDGNTQSLLDVPNSEEFRYKGLYKDGEINVHLQPFEFEDSFEKWFNEKVDRPREEVKSKINSKGGLKEGENVYEKIFRTIHDEAQKYGGRPENMEMGRETYKEILRNEAENLKSIGVHETAHHVFNDNFEYMDLLPDVVDSQKFLDKREEIKDKNENSRQDRIDTSYEALKAIEGDNKAENYSKFSKVKGIDEVFARIVENDYRGILEDISCDSIFDNGLEEAHKFTYSRNHADLRGVQVEKMKDYILDEGYDRFLNKDIDSLIEEFYD